MENNYQKRQKSRFLKIKCPRCNSQKIVFGKASTVVKCDKCNKLLIQPGGGKAKIKAKIKKIMQYAWKKIK
jgi:small subunit ribosomal protein S27e